MSKKTIDFSTYSSIKIGPEIAVDLIDAVDSHEELQIIGKAFNLLISPEPPPLCVLSKAFDFIKEKEGLLHVGAATVSGKLLSYARKHDLAGFELLTKLPGSLGGLLKMNAGLKGDEISKNLVAIRTHQGWIPKEELGYGYRTSNIDETIFEALFTMPKGFQPELAERYIQMRDNQPGEPSAGSCFKNPPDDYAGRLIESVGLKGERIGDMAFSGKHANFLVNLGSGTYEEATRLIKLAASRVFESHGVVLEKEIIVL